MIGITSYGAYIPRLRISRQAIYGSMGWFAPALLMVAQGERSMANWDEDSLTMAVAAAQDCLLGQDKVKVKGVYMASTTFPFADRQNAGILARAMNLDKYVLATDLTGAQKAGTSALITALEQVRGDKDGQFLVAAADARKTKPASFYEMWYGDGAAALTVGQEQVVAQFLGSFSLAADFNDHFRGTGKEFDSVWEERWARDEGYAKLIPETVTGLLKKLDLTMDGIDKLVIPCVFKRDLRKLAKLMGADPAKVADNLHEVCGETGCAHALVMLVKALEEAGPGEKILVVGFGHGCDALCFEVTPEISSLVPRRGVKESLAHKKVIENYSQYLVFKKLLRPDLGLRGEVDQPTALSVLWRKNKMLLGLVGGKCRECGTPQFPKQDICVNPACGALHSQDDYEFSGQPARIKSFTGDLLAASIDPPHKYGLIEFDNGGRMLADFTDCDLEELRVGLPMEMTFRIRMEDERRGFRQYFWKARPVPGAAEEMDKLRFDGQVAIITGAGGGLGRIYALELAKRGAKVVVNDLGGSRDGTGASQSAADKVVQEIQDLGGEAVASYDSVSTVEGGENIVKTALDNFGRVDILINNAGILRDKTLAKMDPASWQAVVDVHLNGVYNVTRPAYKVMREQKYGRIIMTASAAGLYGNFGQTNYSSAKMGQVGFMNTVKLEGAKNNIKINTIAPLAASRLTEDILPPDLFEQMKPEYVAPMVLYLASEDCQCSGYVFNCGLGYFNRAAYLTGRGIQLGDPEHLPTVEDIAEHFEEINSLEGAKEYNDANSALMGMFL